MNVLIRKLRQWECGFFGDHWFLYGGKAPCHWCNKLPEKKTQPDIRALKAGVRYAVHPDGSIREHQTGSETSEGSLEKGTSVIDSLAGNSAAQATVHFWEDQARQRDRDIRTAFLPRP